MNRLAYELVAIVMLVWVAWRAPSILALNRGKILRNIALWLAIFAGLGFVYQVIYGDKPPAGIERLMSMRRSAMQPQEDGVSSSSPAPVSDKIGGHYNFTPPGE